MNTEIWIVVGFFVSVMALITGAGYALILRPALAGGRPGGEASGSPLSNPETPSARALLEQAFRSLGRAVPASEAEADAVRKRLISAGYRSPSTVPLFYGLKCAAALLLGILLGWGAFYGRHSLSTALAMALGAAFFGYALPDRILRRMTQARGGRIRRALPDALDLLVLCVEAGQSLDQAITDASFELKRTHPDLSAEFALAHLELQAGQSRAQSLRNLADRNADAELRKLVNLLIQSDRFGTSVGPALRVHAKYLRVRRKQEVEEAARKISVKLLAPIFLLIFPSMMLVTAGPAVLQIFTQLLPMMAGE